MQQHDVPATTPGPQAPAHEALAQRLVHLPDQMGADAIPELRRALDHPDPWVRLHAVEGLACINHPDAHVTLARALHDDSFGVHWEASRVLAGAGRTGVEAVLRALLHETPTTGFLHGAAYVLRHARLTPEEQAVVAPVLDTLRRPVANLDAPMAAFTALSQLAPGAVTPAERPEPWYRNMRGARRLRAQSFAPASPDDTMP